MIEKIKNWCKEERLGRTEEETSQDMFPTNGDILLWWGMMIPIIIAICISIVFIRG